MKFTKITSPYLFNNYSEGLGFCYFTAQQIGKYRKWFSVEAVRFPNHPNRIYYLAERMKVSVINSGLIFLLQYFFYVGFDCMFL